MSAINEFEKYLNGQSADAYRFFGSHKAIIDGKEGFIFRVYAPMAKSVSLIGEFNNWDNTRHVMKKTDDRGLYEIFVPDVKHGSRYKYQISGCDGYVKDKQDPFAFANELKDQTCSYVVDIDGIHIHDEKFLSQRDRNFNKPVSIYEIHMGTWQRKSDNTYYNYSELADIMIPYLIDMGYTHVEMLPVFSYPNDASWGYQSLGYYSIDRRWGTLSDFAQFVEKMHKANIGLIMDFVPAHFAIDPYGLERFDGSCVYEYSNNHEFSQWGTKCFDLGKDPVRSFLISSVAFMADIYHIDGFRFDAVSNMIYWDGNPSKGENKGAIEFLRRSTQKIHDSFPTVMMIAEDSSAFGHVTKGFDKNGLGFDYKWDLGWMNDTLKYYGKDPLFRKYSHYQLTFSMAYFYSENFILPFSHDEVVHMKGSISNKMWGDYDAKMGNLRNLYAYQFAHPGKKLSFMGNEFGTFNEWKEYDPIMFDLLKNPKHEGIRRLTRDLNEIYRNHPCMYLEEFNPASFGWIMADNGAQSVYVFKRESKEECIVFIFNMTPNFFWDYDIGVPYEGTYQEILNTDKTCYGGWGQYNELPLTTHGNGLHNQKTKITVKIPSYGAIYLLHKKNVIKNDDKDEATLDDPKKLLGNMNSRTQDSSALESSEQH